MKTVQLAIIGGGPAGLAAAAAAYDAGLRDILILERSGELGGILNQFTAAGGSLTGYADSLYATQLQASAQATGSSRCRLLGDCERQLLSDAVAVPLFAQQKRLLIAPGIQNLIFDPFGPVLDLTYTTKE